MMSACATSGAMRGVSRMTLRAAAAAVCTPPLSIRQRAMSDLSRHPSGLAVYSAEGRGTGLDLPPSRDPLYQASPMSAFMRSHYLLFKAMGVFSSRAKLGQNSEAIYRSIEEQATQNLWWEVLKLPKTWISEHALIALHVWMFHCRFKVDYNVTDGDEAAHSSGVTAAAATGADGSQQQAATAAAQQQQVRQVRTSGGGRSAIGRLLRNPGEFSGRRAQEQLFERLWEDTILRIRNAGVAEISVNKQLEHVQKTTFDALFNYDAALRAEEEEGDSLGMEMAAAVWKGVFREDEHADTESVLKLADYVRRELFSLMLQPREDVYRGWITWGPVVGEAPADRSARQRRMLEGEWRDALAQDGRVYFYHTATHERRWEPPSEGFYGKRRFSVLKLMETDPAARAALLLPQNGGNGSDKPVLQIGLKAGSEGSGAGSAAGSGSSSGSESFAKRLGNK